MPLKPGITAHCIVKNEEYFIWYALQSTLPYVEEMLIYDTGSTDQTASIIKKLIKENPTKKITFQQKGIVNTDQHTALRNEMINKTTTEWFMILDGDEVWPHQELQASLSQIKKLPSTKSCVLSKFILSAGDVYHYSTWGGYSYDWGLKGNYTPRFLRKKDGIHWRGKFDGDTLFYDSGQRVTSKANCLVSDHYFFHFGILPRSSRDRDVSLGHGRRVVDYTLLGSLGHGKKLPPSIHPPEIISKAGPFHDLITKKVTLNASMRNFLRKYT